MNKQSNFSKFMLLWAGELISAVGGGLTSFGLGVYVFRQTGSAASMALVTLLAFLPTLLLSIPAGVLADRHDRRLLMMLGDGCSALGILYILLCMMWSEAALWQICTGVFISSTFSALLEPSYRAAVTDLLTKEEYSKASGLVSLAGSARYLISPVLAGALLAVSDIKLLLVIDICTFFPTVFAAFVRKGIEKKVTECQVFFIDSLRQGWRAVTGNHGILILIVVSAALTCFMGTFQTLAQPLILDFADSTTLGIGETICASGMLVSSLFLGAKGIQRGYVKTLCLFLLAAGVSIAGFGICLPIWISVLCLAPLCQQLPGLFSAGEHPGRIAGTGLGADWVPVADRLCGGLRRGRGDCRRHRRPVPNQRGPGCGRGCDGGGGSVGADGGGTVSAEKRPGAGAQLRKMLDWAF